jgi:hypothetical protein
MMIRILLSKYVLEQVEMKQRFLLESLPVAISSLLMKKDLKQKLQNKLFEMQDELKKWFLK